MTDNEFNVHRTALANRFASVGAELLEHMAGTAGALAAIPNTQPQQYAVAGDPKAIRALLPQADDVPARRMRKGDRPSAEELEWEPEPGEPRRFTVLLMKGTYGLVEEFGHTFPHALAHYERVNVAEILPEQSAPAGTVLTDEQLRETGGYKMGWMEGMSEGAELATDGEKTASDVEAEFADLLPGSYYMDPPDGGSLSVLEQVSRMAEDAAKWREVAAQAGQVAVPEGFVLVPIDAPSAIIEAIEREVEFQQKGMRLDGGEIFDAMLSAAIPSPAKESK